MNFRNIFFTFTSNYCRKNCLIPGLSNTAPIIHAPIKNFHNLPVPDETLTTTPAIILETKYSKSIYRKSESRANIDKALYHTEEYDILAVQEVAVDRGTGRAYCPALSRYTVVYSSGRAAIYVHKRWDIKTLEAAEGDDWARITIGEGAAAVTIWSIYSLIQIKGLWNTFLNIIEPENALILVGDFNIHHPLWDIHGRISRGSSEIAAYMLR
jgi:hypothetical protein